MHKTSAHIRRQAPTYVGRHAHMIFLPDSSGLPGTLVNSCSESGLSASEDTDHIREKRRIEAYRLKEGDRRGGIRMAGTGVHIWSTHSVGDLITRQRSSSSAGAV